MLIQTMEKVKFGWIQVRRVWGMRQCYFVLCYEILGHNHPVCWSTVMKEKQNVGSPVFRAFPSDASLR